MFSQINSSQPSILMLSGAGVSDEKTVPAAKEAELRQAAQDFEAAYISQMLTFSGLDKALMAGGGEEVSAFTSFYIENFAEQIAEKGGFGLAQDFYDRMIKLGGSSTEHNEESDNVDFGKL